MKKRNLLTIAAGAAAALVMTAGVPAEATSLGGGTMVGTLGPCIAGTTTITLESHAFVFNGEVGTLTAQATTDCWGSSLIADTGGGTFSVDGTSLDCPAVGGVWQKVGQHFIIGFGGPCTFTAGGGHNVLFRGDAVLAGGVFAGEMWVSPVF